MSTHDDRFTGEICGFGTSSGTRVVVGCWSSSPLGAFADVMVERADGHRILLAPSGDIGRYVGRIYTFDEVVVTPVELHRTPTALRARAGALRADVDIGRRTALGWLLRAVPRPVATSPWWASVLDPVAGRVRAGVRTRGSTAGGEEFYGATDERAVTAVAATWDGVDLGALARVEPPVRFGFGSSPARPSIVEVVTTVRRRSQPTVYEAAGGVEGITRLAHAWHERVLADDVVAHAFSHGYRADHTERLAAYWVEALGGPTTYSSAYGDESAVVRMHSGNGPHHEMDQRATACFDQALVDAGLAGDVRLRQVLHDYFSWATTTTMSRYHDSADDVPDGLTLPGGPGTGSRTAVPRSRPRTDPGDRGSPRSGRWWRPGARRPRRGLGPHR